MSNQILNLSAYTSNVTNVAIFFANRKVSVSPDFLAILTCLFLYFKLICNHSKYREADRNDYLCCRNFKLYG